MSKLTFDTLSKDGKEIALSTIAFSCMRFAAAKALADIRREAKAAAEGSIDAFNELHNAERDEDLEAEATEEIGATRKVTFKQYCALAAAVNDELETLAGGTNWPRPQTAESIVAWLSKTPTSTFVRDDAIKGVQAIVKAHSGHDIDYETAKGLAESDAQNKGEWFAEQYDIHAEDIVCRIQSAIVAYEHYVDEQASYQTLFDNLPANVQFAMLGAIDRKLDDKSNELLSGKRRNGSSSPTARIPMLERASIIVTVRADQQVLKAARQLLAHAGDPVVALAA